MKFYGQKVNGELVISGNFNEFLEKLESSFEIKVTLTRDIRTIQMNNLYWWWLTLLSNHSGYTKTELHNYFKTKILCVKDEVNGEPIMDCKSTSDLTIKEFNEYLQQVAIMTAENFNFFLPDQLP